MSLRFSSRTGLAALLGTTVASAQLSPPTMPSMPDIHGDRVVFCAEGDLWLGDLKAGIAKRITVWPGEETHPRFSPDGQSIAFSGTYDATRDVYVLPISGGEPRRLTYDGTSAQPLAWSADGRTVYFRSGRLGPFGLPRVFSVPATGGLPNALPMPKAATLVPEGDAFLYTETNLEGNAWRGYQGGQANDLWRYDPAARTFTRLTNSPFNDDQPQVVGPRRRVFYISEREGTYPNVHELGKGAITTHSGEVRGLESDGARLVYVVGQDMFTLTPGASPQRVRLQLTSDRIHAQPHRARAQVDEWSLGPTGRRLLIAHRGQIFSAPTEKGDIRTVAAWPGARNKLPRWSHDGTRIAIVSDRGGEENIWLLPATGGEPRQLTTLNRKSIRDLRWSPKSDFLVITDQEGTLWRVDARTGRTEELASEEFGASRSFSLSQSGHLFAYAKADAFNQSSLYIRDLQQERDFRMTQPPTRDYEPVFDRSGRYLYFLSDRAIRPSWDAFDFQLNVTNPTRIFFMALTKEAKNPFAESSDEEPVVGKAQAEETDPSLNYQLDLAPSRLMSIPGVSGDLSRLQAGTRRIYWLEDGTLRTYSLDTREVVDLAKDVRRFELSADGRRLVAETSRGLQAGQADRPLGGDTIDLSGWEVTVDPVQEWRQMAREAWRFMRDNFYDPNLHGADWKAVWERIHAQLPAVADRSGLSELIRQMQAELRVSHMYQGGGWQRVRAPRGARGMGFLGAELEWDGQGMRIRRLFPGDGFEDEARSPLLAPGIEALEGEYLIEIDGKPLDGKDDPQRWLVGSAGRLIRVKLGPRPSGEGARSVWVRPAASDSTMRYFDWTVRNRAFVEGQGNFAYLHIPDMGNFGMAEFTKHFYANLHRDGMILDVRANGGGITSGMILERMRRVIFEYDQGRSGAPVPYHRMGTLSRWVMLTDEQTASDGEYFATGFRLMGLGTSVGTRTWGGYAAVGGSELVDGGFFSVPMQGSFKPNGEWLPDSVGFDPDILAPLDARLFAAGRDSQLERAVGALREALRRNPVRRPGRMVPPKKGP